MGTGTVAGEITADLHHGQLAIECPAVVLFSQQRTLYASPFAILDFRKDNLMFVEAKRFYHDAKEQAA